MRPLPLVVLLLVAGPALAQPAQLTADAIKKIKATTVYIRVKLPNGLAVGSGFLIRKDDKYGFVTTNDHVAAPTTAKRKSEVGQALAVQGIQVVFNSGTGTEWRAAGQVVARDPDRDLACVRFAIPKGKELPEPMSPTGVKATETMPVYICGFPFGEMMSEGDKNPEISIGPASVSSVRSDERGEIKSVQINGALNPGNSGGPVVNAEGKLVGVAVTTIVGAGLGFAVPQEMVKQMMDGRVSEPKLIRLANGLVQVKSFVVDPLGKVKLDKGWIAPIADLNKVKVPSVSELKGALSFPLIGQPVVAVNGNFMVAVAQFPLAPGVSEAWVQSAWKDADGNTRKGLAHRAQFVSRSARGGMPGGDDDGPGGSLPPEFFDDGPGGPSPGGPGAGPFAGPGAPRGPFGVPPSPAPFGGDDPANPGGGPRGMTPRPPNPNNSPAPFGGASPRPGKPAPSAPFGPIPAPAAPNPGGTPTTPGTTAEEEEAQPARPTNSAPATQPPAMNAPPTDNPFRPPVAADEGGVSTATVVLAVVFMLAAVVGVVGVGAAIMYSGKKAKKKPKRRPARDWDDDDDEDDDDRPRRRRR